MSALGIERKYCNLPAEQIRTLKHNVVLMWRKCMTQFSQQETFGEKFLFDDFFAKRHSDRHDTAEIGFAEMQFQEEQISLA
jgi:hypothetical protein